MVESQLVSGVDDVESDYDELTTGTYEEALAIVGRSSSLVRAEVPVELGLVKALSALLEDPNPCYWDRETSNRLWGAEIAPGALLIAVFAPLRWHPHSKPQTTFAAKVPLPGNTMINAGTEQQFERPLRVGDWLSCVETVMSVSPLKNTRKGAGHFVVTSAEYRDQDDEVVARTTNTLFRYTPGVSAFATEGS